MVFINKLIKNKVLLSLLILFIFVVIPFAATGAIWVQNVGLLPGTAVVFSSDTPAIDRFMAAAFKPAYGDRIGICDGIDDDVEIQAALPAAGGEVLLREGPYDITTSLSMDSYQTLRGCGRNTILTTSTADLVFISAVGGAGTEKTGIVIADLQIDGTAGAITDCGISFVYVDYSFIQNVYSRRNNGGGTRWSGIHLLNSDYNSIIGNDCQENYYGINLKTSTYNTITENICQTNDGVGIYLETGAEYNILTENICTANVGDGGINIEGPNNIIASNSCCGQTGYAGIMLLTGCDNTTITGNYCEGNAGPGMDIYPADNLTITGNNCEGNGSSGIVLEGVTNSAVTGNTSIGNAQEGISLYNATSGNTVSGNHCQGNGYYGISIATNCHHNNVIGNTCIGNSQDSDNARDNIYLLASDYNLIMGNLCRDGGGANQPRYGINISNATCDGNVVKENDLYDSGKTAPFNDAGTDTELPSITVPFSDGSEAQDSGYLIDADTEYARAWSFLNKEVTQVVRMKVYARAVPEEAGAMRAEFVIYGGADNEAYNTHDGSIANHPSTSANFAADDVIYWTITEAGVLALLGGDSVEIKVLHEAVGNGDIDTQAYFRTVTIEYVQ